VSSFRNTCPYHRNLFCCSINIISSIPSLSLNSWLGILSYLNITHPSDYFHLCSLKCHLIFFPDRPGLFFSSSTCTENCFRRPDCGSLQHSPRPSSWLGRGHPSPFAAAEAPPKRQLDPRRRRRLDLAAFDISFRVYPTLFLAIHHCYQDLCHIHHTAILQPSPLNHNLGLFIFTHIPLFSTLFFHSLSLLIKSSLASAITTKSSAYNSS